MSKTRKKPVRIAPEMFRYLSMLSAAVDGGDGDPYIGLALLKKAQAVLERVLQRDDPEGWAAGMERGQLRYESLSTNDLVDQVGVLKKPVGDPARITRVRPR